MPAITAFVLLMLIASWAIVTGAFQIAAAIQLRKHIKVVAGTRWRLLDIIWSCPALQPPAGGLAVVWIIGAYAIVFGLLLMALGFKLRGLERLAHGMTPHPV
jgi:uncharacterized membrane protein HdeD (DUF308 family)